jgi:hypothetical protein
MNSLRITASAMVVALAFPTAAFASDFQVVHAFDSPGGGGLTPIVDGRGIVFGLALNGDHRSGALYQYDGQTYQVLHQFQDEPFWLTSDGTTLYGTEVTNAAIWAWDATRGFRVLAFSLGNPANLVVGSDGMVYFTSPAYDERYPRGASAFERLDPSTGDVTVLSVTSHYLTNGMTPPVSHGGRIYGSNNAGPWAYSPKTGRFEAYHDDHIDPGIGFAHGGVYGAVALTGTSGAFYRFDATDGYQVVAPFVGGAWGPYPAGNFATGTDGRIYAIFYGGVGAGTCGDRANGGFIYQFDPVTLQQAALHDFCENPDGVGVSPAQGFAATPDGSLYGTVWTPAGGYLYRFVP